MSSPSRVARQATSSSQGHGLIPDEHRYREAAVKHKRLDLANRRLDARISSLESLATQGTLLAGFGYGTLTREDAEREASLIEAIISCLRARSRSCTHEPLALA